MIKKKIKEIDKLNIIEFKEIRISSERAYIQMIIFAIFVPITFGVFLWIFSNNYDKINGIFATAFGFVFLGFMIYFLTKLHIAKIIGDKLKVKRLFAKSFDINVIDIIIVNTFKFSGISYLSIKFKKFEVVKNIWIMKPSIFSDSSDVDKVIKFSMQYFKLKLKK